jgi:hypothetical protein
MTYPKLKFPLQLIVFFPTQKAPVTPEGTKLVRDIELTNGKSIKNVPLYYELTGCSMLGSKKKDSLLVGALKTTLRRLRNEPTTHTQSTYLPPSALDILKSLQ